MRRSSLLALALSLSSVLAGCPGGGDPVPPGGVPLLYTEVDMDDDELAMEALRILGAPEADGEDSCATCHGITRRTITTWAEQAQIIRETCLTDLAVASDASAAAMVACLHGPTTDGMTGMYRASSASIFSAAAHGDWFRYVFAHGAGASWESELEDFVQYAGMPNEGEAPLTQDEIDVIFTWFLRGAPGADDILPIVPPPEECVPFVSPEVADHVARMATDGWAARNLADGILMHGCAGAATPADCLADEPAARDLPYGEGWDVIEGSTIRELFTTTYASSFWTRSSADGRYVAHGPGFMIDLQRDLAIPVSAPYDPGFFPDNSAFVWPGVACEQSLLATATNLTLDEAGCSSASIGLYEHVGVGLGGNDYWVITGEYASDNGGHGLTTEDTPAGFTRSASQHFVRMVNGGGGFVSRDSGSYPTPFEGDGVISPSSTTVLARMAGPDDRPLGYSLYAVEMGEPTGGGTVGSCGGTPVACEGRPLAECSRGCSAGACSGTAAACDGLTSMESCTGQSGCAWSGSLCIGTARACDVLTSSVCATQDGCTLEGSGECTGTPDPCVGASTQSSCEAADGCSWSTMPGPTTGTVALREIARYCMPGTKAAFSYDERYFITHHYNVVGSADIWLVELATGIETRLTNMSPGQYALFPHFRSDGWIYFLVRGDTGVSGERVMASDAIFHLD